MYVQRTFYGMQWLQGLGRGGIHDTAGYVWTYEPMKAMDLGSEAAKAAELLRRNEPITRALHWRELPRLQTPAERAAQPPINWMYR